MSRTPPTPSRLSRSRSADGADEDHQALQTRQTREILDALRRIVRDLRHPVAPDLVPPLGPARLFVLQQIAEHGPIGVSALARRTHTAPASVSVVVQHLVTADLVTRTPSSTDRRRLDLTLTAAGRKVVQATPPAAQHRLFVAIERLGPTKRATLARLLSEVLADAGSDPRAPLFFEDEAPRPRRSPR